MYRLDGRTRAAIIIGMVVAPILLFRVSETFPAAAPLTWPLLFVCLAFALWTRLAGPVVNLLLLLKPIGREVIPKQHKRALISSSLLITVALALFAIDLFLKNAGLGFAAFGLALFAIPLTVVLKSPGGWHRRTLAIFVSVLALIGLLTVSLLLTNATFGVTVPNTDVLIICGILIFFGDIPLSMVLESILRATRSSE